MGLCTNSVYRCVSFCLLTETYHHDLVLLDMFHTNTGGVNQSRHSKEAITGERIVW